MTDTTSNTTHPNTVTSGELVTAAKELGFEPTTVTSDEQITAAKQLGFVPTRVWMLNNPPKKPRSPEAERIKKSRDLAKQKGLAQLNVSLPESLHGFVKELAKRARAGVSLEAALAELVPTTAVVPPIPAVTDLPVWPTLPRWKRWLVGRLIRNKS